LKSYRLGCEGIVSKRLGSPYRPGRSPHWVKVKNPNTPAAKREAEEDWGALIVEAQQILFWSGLRRRLRSIWCYSLNGRHFCYSHRCWRQKPDDQKADAEVTENAHGEMFVGVAKKPQHLGAKDTVNVAKLPELVRKD
jgi:hypothetical protein